MTERELVGGDVCGDATSVSRSLIVFLLFVLLLIPGLLLWRIEFTDPFIHPILADAQAVINTGHLFSLHESSAQTSLLVALSNVTGVPLSELSVVPIGTVVVPFCFFALSRRLFKSNLLAAGLAIYVACDVVLVPTHYNIFAYAWTRPLFFMFVLLHVILVNDQARKWIVVPLLWLIFLATFFTHSTYAAWMISFTFAVYIILLLEKRFFGVYRQRSRLVGRMAISFVVFYMFFSNNLYGYYLPKLVEQGSYLEAIPNLDVLIRTSVGTHVISQSPYLVTPVPSEMIGWAALCRHAVIFLCIALMVLYRFKGLVFTRMHMPRLQYDYLIWALIATGLVHVGIYWLHGRPTLRFSVLMFPIVAVLCLTWHGRCHLSRYAFVFGLAFLAVAMFVAFLSAQGQNPQSTYSQIESSGTWLLSVTGTMEADILTDYDTGGKYLLNEVTTFDCAEPASKYTYHFFNSYSYGWLVAGDHAEYWNAHLVTDNSFVVIDEVSSTRPTHGLGWKYYLPLSDYHHDIRANHELCLIYADDNVSIFKKG